MASTEASRERTGSASSYKRKKGCGSDGEMDEEEETQVQGTIEELRASLEELIYNESNKINKGVEIQILRMWRQMEAICTKKRLQNVVAAAENKVLKK